MNNKKGFVPIITVLIIALFSAGVVSYIYLKPRNKPIAVIATTTTTTSTTTTTTTKPPTTTTTIPPTTTTTTVPPTTTTTTTVPPTTTTTTVPPTTTTTTTVPPTTTTTKLLVKEKFIAGLRPAITIGGYVHQLHYSLSNNSSQAITVIKVEFFDENSNIQHTVSQSTLQETSHGGQLLSDNTFNWNLSFQIPYSTKEIEKWQVKWYCLDSNSSSFIVSGDCPPLQFFPGAILFN